MQCPLDGETLLMTSREGVEIDYCPKCRGVWLDRGELDKIIERSASDGLQDQRREKFESAASRNRRDDDDDDDDDDDRHRRKDEKKRREKSRKSSKDYYKKSSKHASFIKELFDF